MKENVTSDTKEIWLDAWGRVHYKQPEMISSVRFVNAQDFEDPRAAGVVENASIVEWQNTTLVKFGSGSIQMGVAVDDLGQVQVHLADVMRDNPIGHENGAWEKPAGRTVILGFNKISSIEVLEETLARAKEAIRTGILKKGEE